MPSKPILFNFSNNLEAPEHRIPVLRKASSRKQFKMDKQSRKNLKRQYLETEREKVFDDLANDKGNDPLSKFTKMLLAPPLKKLTKEFILTTSDEVLEAELTRKVNEEIAEIRRTAWANERKARLLLNPYKRMMVFTHIFEGYAGMGDLDKFIHDASHEEVDGAIEGYKLIGQLEVANLISEAKDTVEVESTKLYSYFEEEGRVGHLVKHKIAFIRQNAEKFSYE